MTLTEAFVYSQNELAKANIASYRLEATRLIEHALSIKQDELYLRLFDENEKEKPLTLYAVRLLKKNIRKRASGYPLQYILGKWEFYGNEFFVGEGAFIPRQETELLVEAAIEKARLFKNARVFDVCSGTGCIGISIAKALPECYVTIIECWLDAFKYYLKNKALNKTYNISGHRNDALNEYILATFKLCNKSYDVVVSNPPYIPTAELATLQAEVQHEPQIALNGREDGLFYYRGITKAYKQFIPKGGYLLYEIGINQCEDVKAILINEGFSDIEVIRDYAGIERVVIGKYTKKTIADSHGDRFSFA